MSNLFDDPDLFRPQEDGAGRGPLNATLGQYMTPMWAAEALVERYFPHLDSRDVVCEPSCGEGSFLRVIPPAVRAFGVEIDPVLAQIARTQTGREVLTGDFRTVPLAVQPTAIIGNPPFQLDLVDAFLERAHGLLPDGGRVGFLLPAYAFQTAQRVAEYGDLWSMTVELVPRNIFAGLSKPLVFAMFSKDRRRLMVGLALYREATDVKSFDALYREALEATQGSLWEAVGRAAILARGGGRCHLKSIYEAVEGKRPTRTQFWREKIRQTLRRKPEVFRPLGEGYYELAVAA